MEEEEDGWVKSAMEDDSMVVELLMRMKLGNADSMRRSSTEPPLLVWGSRKSRSSLMRCSNNSNSNNNNNNDGGLVSVVVDEVKKVVVGELTRASPTTPFSWSTSSPVASNSSSGGGGGGVGGGGGGCLGGDDVVGGGGDGGGIIGDCGGGGGGGDFSDESNRRNPRSDTNKDFSFTATATTNIRRSRKKKTLTELKEEEVLLLKEKSHLRKELRALQLSYEEKKSRNDGLKRIKLDLQSQSIKGTSTSSHSSDKANFSYQSTQTREAIACSPTTIQMNVNSEDLHDVAVYQLSQPSKKSCEAQNSAVAKESLFVLPDLNMPLEEDSGTEDLYGLS